MYNMIGTSYVDTTPRYGEHQHQQPSWATGNFGTSLCLKGDTPVTCKGCGPNPSPLALVTCHVSQGTRPESQVGCWERLQQGTLVLPQVSYPVGFRGTDDFHRNGWCVLYNFLHISPFWCRTSVYARTLQAFGHIWGLLNRPECLQSPLWIQTLSEVVVVWGLKYLRSI